MWTVYVRVSRVVLQVVPDFNQAISAGALFGTRSVA
jgi:hypothetical protein